MRILVTGATGFVMASLVRHLADLEHSVVASDRVPPDAAFRRFLSGRSFEFHPLDVLERPAVRDAMRLLRPERVVHGAAITALPADAERTRFVETVEVNVIGTLHVLDAALASGAQRVVAVSSGSVYGSCAGMTSVPEGAPKDPHGVYPISKWAGDQLARRFGSVHGLDVAVARLASPFGPLERDTGSRPLLSPLAYWTAAAVRGEPVRVASPHGGGRDIAYVGDIASAVAAVLLAPRLAYDGYNIGWGHVTTTDAMLAALSRIVPDVTIERLPDEPSPWVRPRLAPLAIDRLRDDLGWSPAWDLDQALTEYVAWLRGEIDLTLSGATA
jgi:dTDP-glucose 4,6-dehydratase/UDP-glucose 4-epimerase/GDP-4-dehydro-6-deoxy-D-mannose reductase